MCQRQGIGVWHKRLTGAVVAAVGNDVGGILGRGAGLVGAVADAVAVVDLFAVADDVALGATEIVDSDVVHVGHADLLWGG